MRFIPSATPIFRPQGVNCEFTRQMSYKKWLQSVTKIFQPAVPKNVQYVQCPLTTNYGGVKWTDTKSAVNSERQLPIESLPGLKPRHFGWLYLAI